MAKIIPDPDDENSVLTKVKDQRDLDMFGRTVSGKRWLKITHFDGYGVIVRGAHDVDTARLGLVTVGYDAAEVAGYGYRPHMADQEPSEWPNGLAVGGVPAVAFYFLEE